MAHYSNILCRKQYHENVTQLWQHIQTQDDYCDVTLICDSKQTFAPKLILSSYSPVFKTLLKNSINQHKVIFLSGIEYGDLKTMLDFIYQGQVNIAEKNLESFLKVAEDFMLRGLSIENGINLIPEPFVMINQMENKNI